MTDRPASLTPERARKIIAETPFGGFYGDRMTPEEITCVNDTFMDDASPFRSFRAVVRAIAAEGEPTSYRVEWSIDIEADTPEAAARQAWAHMRRHDSTANVFTVISASGDQEQIDLQEIDEAAESKDA